VVGWEIIGWRLGIDVLYRVHLAGTPRGEEIEIAARDLVPWAG
jgi:hypothetical protein